MGNQKAGRLTLFSEGLTLQTKRKGGVASDNYIF